MQDFFNPLELQQLLNTLRLELAVHKTHLGILLELSKRHHLRIDTDETQRLIDRLELKIAQTERQFTIVN